MNTTKGDVYTKIISLYRYVRQEMIPSSCIVTINPSLSMSCKYSSPKSSEEIGTCVGLQFRIDDPTSFLSNDPSTYMQHTFEWRDTQGTRIVKKLTSLDHPSVASGDFCDFAFDD